MTVIRFEQKKQTYTPTKLSILPIILSLSWPLHCFSMDSDEDGFDFDERKTSAPRSSTSAAPDTVRDQSRLLSEFLRLYAIVGHDNKLIKDSSGADKVKIRVSNRRTGQTTDIDGILAKGLDGRPIEKIAIKNLSNPHKPAVGRDNNLEPLLAWYRQTVSYPTFAIQLQHEKYAGVRLKGFYEVPTLSSYHSNVPADVYVSYEENRPQLSVEVFVNLRCAGLGGAISSHSLGVFEDARLGGPPPSNVYHFQSGTDIIERRISKELEFELPHLLGVPGLSKKSELPRFKKRRDTSIPITGCKAQEIIATTPPIGDYRMYEEEDVNKDLYVYVEQGPRGPQFFLTRTIELRLEKVGQQDVDREDVVLKYTQKLGLILDVKAAPVGYSSYRSPATLNTGLYEQTQNGVWYEVSKTYEPSDASPKYHFKITKVRTSEPILPRQLLRDLHDARRLFYSNFMTLELSHPFVLDENDQGLAAHHELSDKFFKIISKSYPPFPLPRKLRFLQLGGDESEAFSLTRTQCGDLGTLPLNRLILTNVQVSEELLRMAMDHSEGVYSEASIDLRRGYCLESFDEKQGDCLAKQKMEKQREKDLEAEFRNFCR